MGRLWLWLTVLGCLGLGYAQDSKSRVMNNLIPFEWFVGTPNQNQVFNINDRLKHWYVPGVSVAVINNYQVEWSDGFGFAQPGQRATDATSYQAGTLSSFLTALVVMQLVQQGTLDIEKPVNDYLQIWKYRYKDELRDRTKLKHILSHSGGVNREEFYGYKQGAPMPNNNIDILEGTGYAKNRRVRMETNPIAPGTGLGPGNIELYSSGGYQILQQLIEEVTGQNYLSMVTNQVLNPTGMFSSDFNIRQGSNTGGAAFGYVCNSSEATILPGNWENFPQAASQGLWSNVKDLSNLLINVASASQSNPQAIIDAATLQKMLTKVLTPDPILNNPALFGLGTEVIPGSGGSTWFVNTGYSEGYCAEALMSTDGRGLVMMANQECDRAHQLLGEIFRSVATEYNWADALANNDIPFSSRLQVQPALTTSQPWEGIYKLRPISIPIPDPDNPIIITPPFETICIAKDHFEMNRGVCRVKFYPCANKEGWFCPAASLLQDVDERMGEFYFQKESNGKWIGKLHVHNLVSEVWGNEVYIYFDKIGNARSCGKIASSAGLPQLSTMAASLVVLIGSMLMSM